MGYLNSKLGASQPDQDCVLAEAKEIANEIRSILKLEKVILFGSAAKREFTNTSDLDFLLIFDSPKSLKIGRKKLRECKFRSNTPRDFVFVHVDEFARKSNIGGVCMVAKENGIEL